MTDLSWFRSWHGAPMDHKWSVIAARTGVKTGIISAIAWALLDYASQQDERGSVAGFDVETYSVYSGFSEAEINAVMQAMTDKGILHDGRWAKWDERQPKSEREIERVRQWRAARTESEPSQVPPAAPDQENIALRDVTDCYEPLQESTQIKIKIKSNNNNDVVVNGAPTADIITTWSVVTGMMDFPARSKPDDINRMQTILAQQGAGAVAYLQKFFDAWCNRKYSKSNTGWLDWALANDIPRQRTANNGATSRNGNRVYALPDDYQEPPETDEEPPETPANDDPLAVFWAGFVQRANIAPAYRKYLNGTVPAGIDGDTVRIAADARHTAWLNDRMKRLAENELSGVLNRAVIVEFVGV